MIGYVDVVMCHAAQHPSVQDLPTAADLSSSKVPAALMISHAGQPATKQQEAAACSSRVKAEPVAPTGIINEDKRRIQSLGADLPADSENDEPRTPKRRRREAKVQEGVDEPMTPPFPESPLVRRIPRRGAKAASCKAADGR